MDEEAFATGEAAFSPSPPPIPQSPRSEVSPAPSNWTAAHEQAAQEAYEYEIADQYIYNLMRRFASATRALSIYECSKCISELEKLPHVHQMSAGVLAMVGRAHYERLEYASVGYPDPCNFGFSYPSLIGGTGFQSRSGYGALPIVGHGGLLYITMAPSTARATFISCARIAQHRPSIVPSLDRHRQPLLPAKGTITGPDVFSESGPNGSNVRLRIYP